METDKQQTTPKTASITLGSVRPSGKRPNFKPLFWGAGMVCISLVGSTGFVWLLLAAGWLKPDAVQTITNNRQQLVLQQGDAIAAVFQQVSPSTVSITTQAVGQSFFGPTTQEGAGSGIIISNDGYILTNKHVVPDGTTSVTVILASGKEYKNVQVVGRDPGNDLAFLKIPNVSGLTQAQLGDSSTVLPGQGVVAIGNALGEFQNSVTSGIVSGIGRPISASDGDGSGAESLDDLIQTDAAINPGNSGGPLVNLKGQVIGINTAVEVNSQGIGFAIPINDAMGMVRSLLAQGKLTKAYLGVRYITLSPDVAQQLHVSVDVGTYLSGTTGSPAVAPGSPADKAGLREHDIITQVNGQALSSTFSLSSSLANFQPGSSISLTYLRDGKQNTASVTLGNYPGL